MTQPEAQAPERLGARLAEYAIFRVADLFQEPAGVVELGPQPVAR